VRMSTLLETNIGGNVSDYRRCPSRLNRTERIREKNDHPRSWSVRWENSQKPQCGAEGHR